MAEPWYMPKAAPKKDNLAAALSAASALSRQLSGWKTGTLAPVERNIVTGDLRPAIPMVVQDAMRGMAAPGNALRGQYDQLQVGPDGSVSQFDPRMMDDAAALAGTIGVSGGAVPKSPNTLGMFGGVMAKTADKAALETAQKMAEKGATKQEIWDATGWFKGADDKWRFEIPDMHTFFKSDGTAKEVSAQWGGTMGNAFRHPRLWEAYPELGATQLKGKARMEGLLGRYAAPQMGDETGQLILNDAMGHNQMNSVALHELQHGVQDIEGFARGGMAAESMRDMPDFGDVSDAQVMAAFVRKGTNIEDAGAAFLNATGRDPSPAARVLLREYADNLDALYTLPASPREAYKRLAGEVEARNVQTRKELTPEQRRAKAPWLTQDVPDELQIVRY